MKHFQVGIILFCIFCSGLIENKANAVDDANDRENQSPDSGKQTDRNLDGKQDFEEQESTKKENKKFPVDGGPEDNQNPTAPESPQEPKPESEKSPVQSEIENEEVDEPSKAGQMETSQKPTDSNEQTSAEDLTENESPADGTDDSSNDSEEQPKSRRQTHAENQNANECEETKDQCDGCCTLDNFSADSIDDEVEPSHLIWHKGLFAPKYRSLKLGCCKYSWFHRRRCCHHNPWFSCCDHNSYYTPRPWGYWNYRYLHHPLHGLGFSYPYYR